MYVLYLLTTEGTDNFPFEANARLVDLLHGDVDLHALFEGIGEPSPDDEPTCTALLRAPRLTRRQSGRVGRE
jgi:hypothetical protein